MKPTEIIGNCHLWLGDCRDILPHLPNVDLVLTDPPYGVNINNKKGRRAKNTDQIQNDKQPPDISFLIINKCILWGGNNFNLPRSTGWLVWFKHHPETSQHSQAELAWTNVTKTIRHYSEAYHGFMRGRDGWFHPTQKPPKLMEWCINLAPKSTLTVADPFMGSGTTGVACANMGKTFYGIEREPKYFEIACKRIEQAYAQGRLFE